MAKKKFFVGTGKKARSSKGEDAALSQPKSEFESRPRRFLVGDGTKLPTQTRDPVTETGDRRVWESLDDVPKALAELEKLYLCEPADMKTIKQLAEISNLAVWELEHRRHDFERKEKIARCVKEPLPADRRRCWNCPYWDINKEATPF